MKELNINRTMNSIIVDLLMQCKFDLILRCYFVEDVDF